MPFLKLLLLVLVSMTCCLSWSQDLDDYKWENRLLFFIAKNSESPSLQKNVRIFNDKDYELTDRDLIILIMNPTNVFNADGSKSNIKPEQVYERFKLISDYEGILLIGKDGGIKLKKPFQVKPEIIFNTIDGMPMRQSELRSRKN